MSESATVSELVDDWELVHSDPDVYRHRRRGGLWVLKTDQAQLVYLPGASLSDLLAMKKAIEQIGKPVAAAPVEPPVEQHDYPRLVIPNSSHVVGDPPNIYIEGLKFNIDRDSGLISVMVRDAAEERRMLAPK